MLSTNPCPISSGPSGVAWTRRHADLVQEVLQRHLLDADQQIEQAPRPGPAYLCR